MRLASATCGLALALLLSSWADAQTTSTILGVTQDSTGGSLAKVRVTVRHIETGMSRSVQSDADGRFLLGTLPVGQYELRAELTGFRTLIRKGLALTVGETVVAHCQLELGALDQAVTVVAEAGLVNTHSGELSYLVNERAIRELPLNGRNYTDLALLQPGVLAYPHRDGGSVVAHGLATSVNGQDPRSNVYLLDGTPQNDLTNAPASSAAGTALGTETIREFRVETNAYSAEFGRNSGGQVLAISKSGSNELHGSLFEFMRNDNLDARNFFDTPAKPEFKRNQFGATLGGPVRRDQSFFFLGYEALRDRLGKTVSTIVPDDNARLGLLPGSATPVAIHPDVKPYLDAYPRSNGQILGGGLAAFSFPFQQNTTQNFVQGRIDHRFNDQNQAFVRYTLDDANQSLPTDYPQFPREFLSRNQFVTAELRQAPGARVLNSVRAGFGRTRVGQNVQANLASALRPFTSGQPTMGAIDIGGLPRFGPQSTGNLRLTQNVWTLEDGVTYFRGRHELKFGGLAERYQANMYNPTFGAGIYAFAGLRQFLLNTPLRFVGIAPGGALDRYWRFNLFALYVQDDVRVHPHLTLNLGLRYEFQSMPRDIHGRDSALINMRSDSSPFQGQLYQNPTYRNISPRFGFAWAPGGSGRLSVRGGYGLFFNTNNQQNLIVTVTNPPATPRIIITNPTFPNPPFERGVGNSIRPVQWDIQNPYVQVWNISVQREFWRDTLLTLGYAGSRGIHLWRSGDVNIPTPQKLADGTLFFPAGSPRPNPAYSTIEAKTSDGNSWYNALIFEARRRWSSGVSFQSSYTFSRNLDTTQASTFFSDATNGTTSAFPEFPGFHYNKGLADYHAKHNWVTNGAWEPQFGRNLAGWSGRLARGWQISAIALLRSGNPLTAFVSSNRSRSLWSPSLAPGIGLDRPSMAAGYTHQSAVAGGPDRYFNPAAFVLQPAGTFGNLGRGALIGPNSRTFDLSLAKNNRWREKANIQFRAEAFNLFNRANFGPPSLIAYTGSADNEQPLATFGRIRSTVTSARQIQFGLRISF
jgi:hypothetical protein